MNNLIEKQNKENERLFRALAEQLKLPFLQIARKAELIGLNHPNEDIASDIERISESSIQLLNNYLLSIKMSHSISLEPVSISTVLTSVARQLKNYAEQYQCELKLENISNYQPVMANEKSLEAALTSIGFVFIESQKHNSDKDRPVITIAAHKSKSGIIAGIYSKNNSLSSELFKKSKKIYGKSSQPLTEFSATSGAGVFIAESLLHSMSSSLRVSHHHKLAGLAASLQTTKQLSWV